MLKVVCVDDDKDVSELMKFAGESQRVWLMTFTNGPEALTFLAHNQVDAVILDLAMPILDGLTLAEEIRKNEAITPARRAVRIAFLTGWPVSEAVERIAERVDASQIFRKPIEPERVIAEVKGWFYPNGSTRPDRTARPAL